MRAKASARRGRHRRPGQEQRREGSDHGRLSCVLAGVFQHWAAQPWRVHGVGPQCVRAAHRAAGAVLVLLDARAEGHVDCGLRERRHEA